jgi:hypothetical protein
MTSSRWVVLLLVALIVTNAIWAYLALDSGVTVAHQSDQIGYQQSTTDLLASLVKELPRNASKNDVYRFLQARYPDKIVKLQADTIEIGEVILEYKQDSLVRVRTF